MMQKISTTESQRKLINLFSHLKLTHHVEGLINPKVRAKNRLLILDTPEHVDSKNIKLKIGSPRILLYQLFSKRDFKN
jgi:hypothetical protein